MKTKKTTILLLLSFTIILGCSKEDTKEEVSLNITFNPEINLKTSYNNYISNFIYLDMSTVFPNYWLGGYNARAYCDFDKDGDIDVMGLGQNSSENVGIDVEYYKNTNDVYALDQSLFNSNIPTYVHARKAITGDFDNNGFTDVVIAGHGWDHSPFPGETQKVIFNTDGVFTTQVLPISGFCHSVCSGDIDNDGDLDLFFTETKNISKFLINDGLGNFTVDTSRYPSNLEHKNFFTSELYDLNKDGFLDLITTGHEQDGANSIVLWGSSVGKYSTNRMTVLPKVTNNGVAIDIDFIDYNGDDKMDILLTRTGDGTGALAFYQGYYLQLLKNEGNTFSDVTSSVLNGNSDSSANWINWMRIQDVDNDGDQDITADDKNFNLVWKNSNGIFTKQP